MKNKTSISENFNAGKNYTISEAGILFKHVLAASGNSENRAGRVYLPESLEFAVQYYNREVERNPYLKFMLDGHHDNPEGMFSLIVGSLQKVLYENGDIYIDFLIYKGSSIYDMVVSIVKSGGVVPISLNGIVVGSEIYRDELDNYNIEGVEFREPQGDELDEFTLNDQLGIVEKLFLLGFDVVHIPSFDDSYFKVNENAIFPIAKKCLNGMCPVQESASSIQEITNTTREFKNISYLSSDELIDLPVYYIEQSLDILYSLCDKEIIMRSLNLICNSFITGTTEMFLFSQINKEIRQISDFNHLNDELISREYIRILFYSLYKRYRIHDYELCREWSMKVDINLVEEVYKMITNNRKGY